MIEIYVKTNTNYNKNGDITLTPSSCTYKDSEKELVLEHFQDADGRWKYIEFENVIAAEENGKKKLYRIYNVIRSLHSVTAYARPIFYDLIDTVLLDVRPTEKNGQEALNIILADTGFKGHSNILSLNTAYYVRKNIVEALVGDDNSFINRWGGEFYCENFDVYINDKIGSDNGIKIELGYNLNEIEEDVNVEEVVTRIVPVGYDGLILDGTSWVDSPLINKYTKPKMRVIEFSDVKVKNDSTDEEGFETIEEARAELVRQCKMLFEGGIDKPSINYKIDMINLANTTEYENFKMLVNVNKGDTVTCYIPHLDIDVKARVIDYEKDLLTGEYISIELGNVTNDFFKDQSDIQNKVDNIFNHNGNIKAETLEGAINALQTKFEALRDVAQPQQVRAILFEDRIEDSPSFGCLCIGTAGFEIASEFKPGTTEWDFRTFGTGKGFTADYIVTGVLNAALIKTGVIRNHDNDFEINLDDGTIKANKINIGINNVATDADVSKAVEGLQVKVSESGGYNLLRNSDFKNNETAEWWYWGNASTYWNKDYFTQTGDMWFGIPTDSPGGLWQSYLELESNTVYTLSVKAGWEHNVRTAKFVVEYKPNYDGSGDSIAYQEFVLTNDDSKRQAITFTTPSNIRYVMVGFKHEGSYADSGYLIHINKPCLTKGIGKVWTPNPMEALDKATSAKQTAEGFNASITQKLKDDYYKKTDIDATVNGLQIKMQESGGYNLLKNGLPSMKGLGGWYVRDSDLNGPDLSRYVGVRNDYWTGNEPALEIQINNLHSGEYRLCQEIDTTPGQSYILTGYIAGHRSRKSIYIRSQASSVWDITNWRAYGHLHGAGSADDYSGWEKINIPFVAERTSTKIEIMIYSSDGSSNSFLWAKKLMVTAGTAVKPWSPNPNELYAGIVDIGREGVVVTHSNGSYTQMSHNGLEHWENGMARPYHYMFDTVVFDAHGKCNGTPFRVQLPEKFRGKRFTLTWQMGNLNVPYDKVSAGHQVNVTNIDYNNATCDVTVKVFTKSKVSGGASADAEAYGWAKIFIVY